MNERKLADDIGTTRAAIAELQSELEILETAAKSKGVNRSMEGDLFRVTIVKTKPSKSTSWKAVATFMKAPQNVINKFSTTKMPVVKVNCTAMIKAEKVA